MAKASAYIIWPNPKRYKLKRVTMEAMDDRRAWTAAHLTEFFTITDYGKIGRSMTDKYAQLLTVRCAYARARELDERSEGPISVCEDNLTVYYVLTIVVTQASQGAKMIVSKKFNHAFEMYFGIPKMHHNGTFHRNYAGIAGTPGSGAGKGGGGGGSIRESGGGLGKYGAAKEEAYFYDKQRKQLEQLKKKGKDNAKTLQKGPE